jgi:pimeloyl-ACP methyl ester carboxylesterase
MSVEGALNVKTVTVPHLTGSKIGYYAPKPIVGSKPTLLLINPWLSSASFFRKQFEDPELADKVNLVAIEPLGHGKSSTKNPQYTLWNSAIAFVQVMDALGIKSAVVLGVSVGGAIAARLALHAPTRVSLGGILH